MAKIKKRNLDSIKRAPVRKSSYEAPSIRNRKKKSVPKEYQTLQRAPKSHAGFLWFLFLLFLAAVGGLFFWSKYTQPAQTESLKFSVSGPEKVISGDQVSYSIKYTNTDNVDLQQMELSVRWPSGFYFDEASVDPADEAATTWFLKDISPNETGELQITGQLVGQKDEMLSAVFNLNYQPANFHSDFIAKEVIETEITDSKINLAIIAQDKTLVSEAQQIDVVLENLTDEELGNLYIDIIYPEDFVVDVGPAGQDSEEETESNISQEGKYWVIGLDKEEKRTISIEGSFSPDSAKDQKMIVEVGNLVDDNFRRLSRVEKQFLAVNPNFDIDLQVNSSSKNQTVNWSEVLRYQLEITNQSQTDINDIQISALLDGDLLDWDTLETVGSLEGNSIGWSKEEDEALSVWAVGETKVFTWQIKVIDDPQPERTIENIIKINIEGLDDWEQIEPPLLLTVGESVSFNNGVYWDLAGRRVGSGLLPPQVGESTQYLAVWSLPEATGDFDSVSIESSLPPQVSFVSETDIQGGELEFDEDSRSLIWTIDNFDNVILPLTASFIIDLIPSQEDQGQAVTLINPTTVTAQGMEEVIVRSELIKTSDVIANTSEPIGIVE